MLTKIATAWPISPLLCDLCFLLLPHLSGTTSWHLSALWSRSLLALYVLEYNAMRSYLQKKHFLHGNLPKFPRKLFYPGQVHASVQRRQFGFKIACLICPGWVSACSCASSRGCCRRRGCRNGSVSEHCRGLPWPCVQESQFSTSSELLVQDCCLHGKRCC